MSVLVLATACSSSPGSGNTADREPQSRPTATVTSEISGLSSQIVDVTAIKAKVTQPGPTVQPCESGDGDGDGDDGSKNKNTQSLAVHERALSQAEITWLKGLDGHEPLIEVNLYSRCFRSVGA
ncbi:hypothetical protein [Streptomyces sp. NBC_01518]|uniref:hypothetical protein n=1 Tax=Streptomyces sp. NBC_01518 TaxID=2903891 RepID=UPI0038655284